MIIKKMVTIQIILLFIGVAFAPSINAVDDPGPDLECWGGLFWPGLEPGSVLTGEFWVENIGEPGSELDWEISEYPTEWGEWSFIPEWGVDLTPEDGGITIEVELVITMEFEESLDEEIIIINIENNSDVCTISAQIVDDSIDNEYVEFDVEFCGLGKKHTVQLTQQEAVDLEQLFDDIEQRLSEVDTREEAEIIFKEAVVELDRYGLLGGLSVRQAQQLIVGNNARQNLLKRIENIANENILDIINSNYFCLIGGHLSHMGSQNPLVRRYSIFVERLWIITEILDIWDIGINWDILLTLVDVLGEISLTVSEYLPYSFFRALGAGRNVGDPSTGGSRHIPSYGIVTSFGLFGFKQWEGDLWGVASRHLIWGFFIYYYPAILGFTGIKLTNDNYETYFLGFALKAKMSNERPDY